MPSLDEALRSNEGDRRSLRELVSGPPLVAMFFLLTVWYTAASYVISMFGQNFLTIGFGTPISVLVAPWWFISGGVSPGDVRILFLFVLWMYIVSAGLLLIGRGISSLVRKVRRWISAEVSKAVESS